MDFLRVLKVNGKIPRRAVLLPDGALAERAAHPGVPEVDLLSRLCELARAANKQPVYPRVTAQLLDVALGGNAAGAWEALRDDMLTGDFEAAAAVAVLRQGSNAATLVTCLVSSRDSHHMLHVACVLHAVLPLLDEELRLDMGRALACQLPNVLDCLVRHGALMGRDVRDAVLDGFGRMLAAIGLPEARVAEGVLYALEQRRDELLRLFLGLPVGFVDHRPQVVPLLLDRAAKYPVVRLLARIIEARPQLVTGHEAQVEAVVCAALTTPDDLDARDCQAVADLVIASAAAGVTAWPGSGRGTDASLALAQVLRRCCTRLLAM